MGRDGRLILGGTVVAGVIALAMWRSPEHSTQPEPTDPVPASEAAEQAEPRAAAETSRLLLVPVKSVERAALRRQFDERRSGGRQHRAIDIAAPRGTPVLAADDGTIARLATNDLGGLTIYQFDRSGERIFYYAHLQRYARGLEEHAEVRRGQVIGYVGTSGNAPEHAPHLHFAVMRRSADSRWWEGEPVDPYDLLVTTRVADAPAATSRR